MTSVTVTVNGGTHAGQGSTVGAGARAVGTGSNYVPYDVYTTSSQVMAWRAGCRPLFVAAVLSGFAVPIVCAADGHYTDTLVVDVSF